MDQTNALEARSTVWLKVILKHARPVNAFNIGNSRRPLATPDSIGSVGGRNQLNARRLRRRHHQPVG